MNEQAAFTASQDRNRVEILRSGLKYGRDTAEIVRVADEMTKKLASDNLLAGNIIQPAVKQLEAELDGIAKNIASLSVSTDCTEFNEVERELSAARQQRDVLAELSTRRDALYERAKNARRHVRQARGALVIIRDREDALRSRRIAMDDILAAEIEEQAEKLSNSLKASGDVQQLHHETAELAAAYESFTPPDFDHIRSKLKVMAKSDSGNVKTKEGEEGAPKADPAAPRERRSPLPVAARGGPISSAAINSTPYQAPPKHKTFGISMPLAEIERASETFFRMLWKEGLPQSKVAEILSSTTSRTDGLTIHDALAYSKSVDELYKSIDELKVKFMR